MKKGSKLAVFIGIVAAVAAVVAAIERRHSTGLQLQQRILGVPSIGAAEADRVLCRLFIGLGPKPQKTSACVAGPSLDRLSMQHGTDNRLLCCKRRSPENLIHTGFAENRKL